MKTILNLFIVGLLSTAAFGQNAEGYNRVDNRFVVKFSPFQMVLGEVNFAYERRLSDRTSIEVEAGPTISQLGVFNNTHIDPFGMQGSASRSAMGGFVSVGFRYYPLTFAKAPRGLYISPVIKYRQYNTEFFDVSGVLDDQTGVKSQLMFRFVYGYQFWLTSNFSLDVFMGMGLGNQTESYFYTYSEYIPETGTYDYNWAKSSQKGARFNATFGFKLGIGN